MPLIKNFYFPGNCPYNCPFCLLENEDTDITSKIKLIIENNGFRIINIMGGDPLISVDLKSSVKLLKKSKKIINIFTSAYYLPEDIWILHNTNVFIHLFSFEKEDHDNCAGKKNAFDTVINNIDTLLKNSISPIILFTVNKLNMGSIPDLLAFCKQKGLFLWLQGPTNEPLEYKLSKDDILEMRHIGNRLSTGFSLSKQTCSRGCYFLPAFASLKEQIMLIYFISKIKILSKLAKAS